MSFTAEQLAKIEAPFTTRWWGRDHTVTPCVIHEPMGDGRKLFAIQPLDTRPQFYVVRLDSRVQIREQIEDILAHIAAQVGDARDNGQDYGDAQWPELHEDCGVCWWRYSF